MMKLTIVTLLIFFSQVVQARKVGVRFLLNEGEIGEGGCSEKDFDTIKNAMSKKSAMSKNFDEDDSSDDSGDHHRELLNCGRICCGFPYGYCGIYQPACAGYPTWWSNRLYCNRRLIEEEDSAGVGLFHTERALLSDEDAKKCRALEKEATVALTSILDEIDDDCADLVLLPSRLQCFGMES